MRELKLNDVILFEGVLYKVLKMTVKYRNENTGERVVLNKVKPEEITDLYLSKLAKGELKTEK